MSSTVATGVVRTGPVSSQHPTSEPPPEGADAPAAGGDAARPASSPPSHPPAPFGLAADEERPGDPSWGGRGRKPRLELVAPEPARVLYEKAQDPSDESPILYCERAYVVDGLQSDDELASHLLAELSEIRESWRSRDSSQFVQLASFDHEFESEPRFPPLATLSWKDWQGRTELWVRGVRRSALPPAEELDAEELEAEELPGEHLEERPPAAAALLHGNGAATMDGAAAHDGAARHDSLAPDDDSLPPSDSLAPESVVGELRRPLASSLGDDGPLSVRDSDGPLSVRGSDAPLSDAPLSDGPLSVRGSDGPLSDGPLSIRGSDGPLSDGPLSDGSLSDAPVSEAAVRAHPDDAPASGSARSSAPPAAQEPRKGDSGTSWQSPARSGEYPIPIAEEPVPAPPSSQRVPAGEELMGLSFERMNELAYLPDLATGADFLVNTLEEFLPCSGIAVHLLDQERREFVLFKALGPRAPERLGSRQPAADSLLGASVQLGRAVRIEGIARKKLWSALGLDVAYGMCSPLQQRGRVLGAVELGRTRAEGEFSDSQLKTLHFICEQFAEFVAEHPFVPQG